MMPDWINPLVAWLGLGGAGIAGLLALAYFVPSFRKYALIAAAGLAAIMTAYTKGNRDRAALEARRKEEAVRKAQKDYAKIDARPDDPASVAKRMRDGSF